jgi:hypothetical protein
MKAETAKASCPRLFEVEALRDGRLTGVEVARFQSHVRTCSFCARELAAIEELAFALRGAPAPTADELHVRRERMRLLAAFDASLVPAPKERRGKLWLGAFAVLAAATMLAFVLQPARPVTTTVHSSDPVKIEAATASQWSRRSESRKDIITLESGTLSIHVDHRLSQRRLLVLLPDGDLEDVGTTFSVTAAASRTTSVTVREGSVILRLRDRPAITLRAGEAWSPATTEVERAPASSNAPIVDTPPPHTQHSEKPLSRAAPAGSLPASASVSAPALADRADPAAEDFRAAMSAFTRGDNVRASSLFAAFLDQYPRDSRREDAAYVRVLTLQRAGDFSAMKRAASEYLVRYPHGFRYAEVEALSR